jgi:hypothetical protein
LTNGFEFWVEHGTVIGFRSSKDVEGMGDTRLFHLAFGPVNLNRNQAIGKARYALRRLGYDLHEIYVDQEPAKVRDPFRWGTNTISIYRVEWNDPLQQNSPAVKIVLSGSDGTICSMEVYSPVFWRRNAAQSVLNSTEKPGDRPWSNVTARMLETGTQLARKFDLPIPLPLALSNVVLIEVSDDTNVKFRTGWWFKYHQERLAGFTAPDSCFGNYGGPYFYSERLPIDRYIGKWNISTNEAISLAQHSITNAGLHFQSLEFGSAFAVLTPSPVSTYVIPRYYIAWETSPPDDHHFELWRADVEVDGDTKAIKHLYVRDHRVPTVGAPTSRK